MNPRHRRLVIPVALVFLLSQRFVISGALTGATKE